MSQTFVMIKPDAVKRGLVGEVVSRFEKKRFSVVSMRMHCMTLQEAEELYTEHVGKPFYDDLIKFTVSGSVVVMILNRINAIDAARLLIGASGMKGAPGTVRGDFADVGNRNLVHASDSEESFLRESAIFFPQAEHLR